MSKNEGALSHHFSEALRTSLSESHNRPHKDQGIECGMRDPLHCSLKSLCHRATKQARKIKDDAIYEFLWDSSSVQPWGALSVQNYLLFLAGLLTASLGHSPPDEGEPYQNSLYPTDNNFLLFSLLNTVILKRQWTSRARAILFFVSLVGLSHYVGHRASSYCSSLTWFDISLVLIVSNSNCTKLLKSINEKKKKSLLPGYHPGQHCLERIKTFCISTNHFPGKQS